MSDLNRWDEIDKRIDRLEALVIRSVCKCTYSSPYTFPAWRAYNGCPVHSPFGNMSDLIEQKNEGRDSTQEIK